MKKEFTKWVSCWGNATSITDRVEAVYAKDITLRYPVKMCLDGNKIRLRFSNLTGTEPVQLTSVYAGVEEYVRVYFDEKESVVIDPGCEVTSDEVSIDICRGDILDVSIYLGEYTQMNAGTLVTGPLSNGKYSYGNYVNQKTLPVDKTRTTNWFYFLNTIDIYTEENNYAIICYGDSITAQSWPDYLVERLFERDERNVAVIRRAVCGTRILREYNCITYAAYGLKGSRRFPIEMNASGVKAVIIQHGINDIIHPVGEENNIFRPWSDMPTLDELKAGAEEVYIKYAKGLGLKVYSGTLLPIYGWRTYEPFRDDIRNGFNEWLRTSDLFDGCIDFDKALRDANNPERFADGFDSGDHLHPSEAAYKAMAMCVPPVKELINPKDVV